MMTPEFALHAIQAKFIAEQSSVSIPMQKAGSFTAVLSAGGIEVDNLGNQPHLPWRVLGEAVRLLCLKGGRAARGKAMTARLGDPELPLDSIEGHIAHVVYDRKVGDSVFRRVTPISCILVWAGICESLPGAFRLIADSSS